METVIIKVGTRKSILAEIQADLVINKLQLRFPDITFKKVFIQTQGDIDKKTDLAIIGGQGVFVKKIQQSLISGEIDLAVHSAKDLPSAEVEGLTLAAYTEREIVTDSLLICGGYRNLMELPKGAIVGTSSLRRRFQISYNRPDIKLNSLRGNIDTRLKKLKSGQYDAIIMAGAALRRYNMIKEDKKIIEYILPLQDFLPAPGQGAIVVEGRIGDKASIIASELDKPDVREAVSCERAFLRVFGLGCNSPLAAYARKVDDKIILNAMIGDLKSGKRYDCRIEGKNPEKLGKKAADILRGDLV